MAALQPALSWDFLHRHVNESYKLQVFPDITHPLLLVTCGWLKVRCTSNAAQPLTLSELPVNGIPVAGLCDDDKAEEEEGSLHLFQPT